MVIKLLKSLLTLEHIKLSSSKKRAYGSLKILPITNQFITILKTKHLLLVF